VVLLSYLIQVIEPFICTVMSFETVVFVVSYLIQAIEAFIRTVMSFETVVFVVSYLIQRIRSLYAGHVVLDCCVCSFIFEIVVFMALYLWYHTVYHFGNCMAAGDVV